MVVTPLIIILNQLFFFRTPLASGDSPIKIIVDVSVVEGELGMTSVTVELPLTETCAAVKAKLVAMGVRSIPANRMKLQLGEIGWENAVFFRRPIFFWIFFFYVFGFFFGFLVLSCFLLFFFCFFAFVLFCFFFVFFCLFAFFAFLFLCVFAFFLFFFAFLLFCLFAFLLVCFCAFLLFAFFDFLRFCFFAFLLVCFLFFCFLLFFAFFAFCLFAFGFWLAFHGFWWYF